MTYTETILVVEDDNKIKNYITYALKNEGYKCIASATAEGALSIAVTEQISLILLDLGLPDFDGSEVIKKIRGWSEIPIIVVSARDQDKEKAAALDLGADDYMTKPFSATELLARIRVALRHYYKGTAGKTLSVQSVGELEIDNDKRLVYLSGKELHLTPMEFSLLKVFFKNIGKVLTTRYIIKEVWGVGYGNDTQALRALMAGLRRKIEINPATPRYIVTEIGVGYRLMDE